MRHAETFPAASPQELHSDRQKELESALSDLLVGKLDRGERQKLLDTWGFVVKKGEIRFVQPKESEIPPALIATPDQMKDVLENVFRTSVQELFPDQEPSNEELHEQVIDIHERAIELGIDEKLVQAYLTEVLPELWVPRKRMIVDALDAPTQKRVSLKPGQTWQSIVASHPDELRIQIHRSEEQMIDEPDQASTVKKVFSEVLPEVCLRETTKQREAAMPFDDRLRARYVKTAMVLTGGLKELRPSSVDDPSEDKAGPFHTQAGQVMEEGDRYEQVLLGTLARLQSDETKPWQENFEQALFQAFQLSPAQAAKHVHCAEQLWELNGGKSMPAFQRSRDTWLKRLEQSALQKEEERMIEHLPHADLKVAIHDVLHVTSHKKISDRSETIDRSRFSGLDQAWFSFVQALLRRHASLRSLSWSGLLQAFLAEYKEFLQQAGPREVEAFHRDAQTMVTTLGESMVA